MNFYLGGFDQKSKLDISKESKLSFVHQTIVLQQSHDLTSYIYWYPKSLPLSQIWGDMLSILYIIRGIVCYDSPYLRI